MPRKGQKQPCSEETKRKISIANKGKPCFRKKEITYIISDNGCWECNSHYKDPKGYPRFTPNGKPYSIAKFMYEKIHGSIEKGKCVCHKCDNPGCINPDHLFVGSFRDNNIDRAKKGRSANGIKHYKHVVTEAQVIEIRLSKETNKAIAERLNVSKGCISSIRTYVTWKHVKLPD